MELDGTNRLMSEFSHHGNSVMCNVTKYEEPLSKCFFFFLEISVWRTLKCSLL